MKTTTEIEHIYSEENDMTFIMKTEYIKGYLKSRECVGWYHGEADAKNDYEYQGKLKAEYSDLTDSTELYYAIVNIMDAIAVRNAEFDDEMYDVVVILARKGKIDLESFADANDCGKCSCWEDVSDAFKRLWKEGKRV